MADERPECVTCGGPCRLESWARDGSFFANNPNAFTAAIARRHAWFDASRAIEVDRIRAETRAMVLAPTFPCVVCQKFSFDRDGVTCYWCGRTSELARQGERLMVVTPADPARVPTLMGKPLPKPPREEEPPSSLTLW